METVMGLSIIAAVIVSSAAILLGLIVGSRDLEDI